MERAAIWRVAGPNMSENGNMPATARKRRLIAAWVGLLAAIAIVSFIDMPAITISGDPAMWREETRSLLYRHTLAIIPAAISDFKPGNEPGQYYVQNPRNGLWYSKYGIVNSLMSFPPLLAQRLIRGDAPGYNARTDPLIFNVWNLFLTLLLAIVLMRLTAFYTERLAVRLLFVVCVFYCTYLWYYLRAQGSEIYQTLFYSAAFLFWLGFERKLLSENPPDAQRGTVISHLRMPLSLMWLFVGLLVLTRVLYLALIPWCILLVALTVWRLPPSQRRAIVIRLWPLVLVPPVLIVATLGTVNYVKFGSPLLSGYHQWRPEQHLPVAPMGDGLYGLLFQPRFSVFIYFPVLTLAAFGLRSFLRRFSLETFAAIGGFVVFVLALSKIPTWAGEWTYGPRYILFSLPIAAIPFIAVLEWFTKRLKTAPLRCIILLIPAAGVLLYSAYLQFRVHELDFVAFYYMLPPQLSPKAREYFNQRPVGILIDTLRRHHDDLDSMAWFSDVKEHYPPQAAELYRRRVQIELEYRNYYWWNHNPN
jgi:hypothetical protein